MPSNCFFPLVTRFSCIDRTYAWLGCEIVVHSRLRNHRSPRAPPQRGSTSHGHSDGPDYLVDHPSNAATAIAIPSSSPSPSGGSICSRPTSQSQSGYLSNRRQSSSPIAFALACRHRSSNLLTHDISTLLRIIFLFSFVCMSYGGEQYFNISVYRSMPKLTK